MEDVLLVYFEKIVSFCSMIYLNSNSLKLYFKNSCLNSTNFTDGVVFCTSSKKNYPNPKIFYTSATCATCDKFHVWCGRREQESEQIQKGREAKAAAWAINCCQLQDTALWESRARPLSRDLKRHIVTLRSTPKQNPDKIN